jgi:hypothetical protein
MTFYLFELFNKIYKFFEIKVFEHKYIQTDSRLTTDNKYIQTDQIIPVLSIEISTQTDTKLLDNQDDSEWDNLTWMNADPIHMV